MKGKVINVILSGGSGTRLWPLSRASKPKQFLQIFDDLSLFQHTVKRNQSIVNDYLLITNVSQIADAEKQVNELKMENLCKIIEPVGRNTAPAIALAALSLGKDDVMIVTPSDHMITNQELYSSSMKRAIELAKENYLVTFGVRPTSPNTGFGYIEYDQEDVISFREKPDLKTAEEFLKKDNFSWNSGMFCFKASVFLEELKLHNKEIYEASVKAYSTINNEEINIDAMSNIPSDSIDYAIMEKSNRIKTVSTNFYWTDLGTFDAIINYFEEENQVSSLKTVENTNSYAFSKKEVFTTVPNLIVVDTEDVILVLEKEKTSKIKQIYNLVKTKKTSLIK